MCELRMELQSSVEKKGGLVVCRCGIKREAARAPDLGSAARAVAAMAGRGAASGAGPQEELWGEGARE
jgi:hypothetical protein